MISDGPLSLTVQNATIRDSVFYSSQIYIYGSEVTSSTVSGSTGRIEDTVMRDTRNVYFNTSATLRNVVSERANGMFFFQGSRSAELYDVQVRCGNFVKTTVEGGSAIFVAETSEAGNTVEIDGLLIAYSRFDSGVSVATTGSIAHVTIIGSAGIGVLTRSNGTGALSLSDIAISGLDVGIQNDGVPSCRSHPLGDRYVPSIATGSRRA